MKNAVSWASPSTRNFTTNNYIYIFYTENSLGARLSRFTANGNVVVPGSEVIRF
ncbi:MAG: hypothetical protein IPM02_28025 [Betaproteobacteria bacterium]|nr:hypothetical protein [Betaproteobacteria bacterium]